MNLPTSVLPYVPARFVTGDTVSHLTCTLERDSAGLWTCDSCEPRGPITDSSMRTRFVDPVALELFGVPLLAPGFVSDDEPLPGRAVAVGEAPFERDRPYLMSGNLLGHFHPIVATHPGPWGTAQCAVTFSGPLRPGEHEVSLTDTGVVWVRQLSRFDGTRVTYAFIPAELPSDDETADLLTAAVLRAAFPADGYAPRVPRHAF
ncbi:hypothetical protein ACFWRZ_09075 [Streptomyces rubiginosohelvolus]|uniref:hypothetical protein n=1 Tax=Streptomyces rubiginosohelvolus TaxID=67362 RepID=UPI0036605AC5